MKFENDSNYILTVRMKCERTKNITKELDDPNISITGGMLLYDTASESGGIAIDSIVGFVVTEQPIIEWNAREKPDGQWELMGRVTATGTSRRHTAGRLPTEAPQDFEERLRSIVKQLLKDAGEDV